MSNMSNVVRRSTAKSQHLLARTRRLAAWMKANGEDAADGETTPETDADSKPAEADDAIADRATPFD